MSKENVTIINEIFNNVHEHVYHSTVYLNLLKTGSLYNAIQGI